MITESTTRIAASPEQIFEFLADPTRWSEYDPTLVEVTPSDRLHVGSSGDRPEPSDGHDREGDLDNDRAGATGAGHAVPARDGLRAHGVGPADRRGRRHRHARGRHVDTLLPTSPGGRVLVAMSRGIMERDLRARSERLRALLERKPPAVR